MWTFAGSSCGHLPVATTFSFITFLHRLVTSDHGRSFAVGSFHLLKKVHEALHVIYSPYRPGTSSIPTQIPDSRPFRDLPEQTAIRGEEKMSYVQVCKYEHSKDGVELPLESDGTLHMATVTSQFPDAIGLKFKAESGA